MGRLLAQPVEIGPVRFSNLALSAGWENGATVQAPVKTNCVPVSAPNPSKLDLSTSPTLP